MRPLTKELPYKAHSKLVIPRVHAERANKQRVSTRTSRRVCLEPFKSVGPVGQDFSIGGTRSCSFLIQSRDFPSSHTAVHIYAIAIPTPSILPRYIKHPRWLR